MSFIPGAFLPEPFPSRKHCELLPRGRSVHSVGDKKSDWDVSLTTVKSTPAHVGAEGYHLCHLPCTDAVKKIYELTFQIRSWPCVAKYLHMFVVSRSCGSQDIKTFMVLQQRGVEKTRRNWLFFFIRRLKMPELTAVRDGSAERTDNVSTLSQSWLHLCR